MSLAASSAPTFFPIAEIEDSLFADGGLYANSPDLLAIHEAEHFLEIPTASIRLLSIGTTTSEFSFAHAFGRNLGLLGWWRDQRLINVIIASQQQAADYIVKNRLGERYLRFDAVQSKEQQRHLAFDVATPEAQKTIRGIAAGSIQSHISTDRPREFLDHLAPSPIFFHQTS
jgi:uncharacterized protein